MDPPGRRSRWPGASTRWCRRFQHRIRPDAPGHLPDAGHAIGAAFRHDVGGAVVQRQVLPRLVAAHGDDASGVHLLRGQHAHQPDRAVADTATVEPGCSRAAADGTLQNIASVRRLPFGGSVWQDDVMVRSQLMRI